MTLGIDMAARRPVPWLRGLDLEPGYWRSAAGPRMQFSSHQLVGDSFAPRWRRVALTESGDLDRKLSDARLDASFDAEASRLPGFMGWWCGPCWRESDGRLTTIAHAEFGYERGRTHAHIRALYAASSDSEGESWSLVGPVITGEAAPCDYGPDWAPMGAGDPKIVIDAPGGHVYAFFMDGYMSVKAYGLAGLTMRVARRPLASPDGAATPWRKWLDHAWGEPGLGGRASSLWKVPGGVGHLGERGSQPTVFYSEALSRFVALANGWTATASSLADQDWTPTDTAFPDWGLWYHWAIDPCSVEAHSMGESFLLHSVETTASAWSAPARLTTSQASLRRTSATLGQWRRVDSGPLIPGPTPDRGELADLADCGIAATARGLEAGRTYRVDVAARASGEAFLVMDGVGCPIRPRPGEHRWTSVPLQFTASRPTASIAIRGAGAVWVGAAAIHEAVDGAGGAEEGSR